ncbi:bleomycin hydrolase-like [Chironomus tepperi]|uniref:bleomycin hydrolase-like n=1 Tax=Chironomus tepperi TaxID=113505 RepID=UPI00391F8611
MSCVVPDCQQSKQSSEKISLHLFPDPRKDPKRHLKWIKAIGSERILKFDPSVVFKRFRVCRNHFSKNCFNGDCKKLLLSAVPTLNISQTKVNLKLFCDYEEKILQMLKNNSVDIEDETFKIMSNHDIEAFSKEMRNQCSEPMETERLWNYIEEDNSTKDNDETDFVLMEVQKHDNQAQYTIVMPSSENIATPKLLKYSTNIGKTSSMQEKAEIAPFNKNKLKQYQTAFNSDPKNLLAQNICSKMSIFDAATLADNFQFFSHDIDMKVGQNIDNIHWSYTLLSMIRVPFMKEYNLTDFEFSQAHFLYHEKVERCYSYLCNLAKVLKSNDKNDRLVSLLLDDPLKEGGRWNIFATIINKYGLMPKEAFKGDISIEKVKDLTRILNTKLREYSKQIMHQAAKNMNTNVIIDSKMVEICNIISLCIGMPPENFYWNCQNDNNLLTSMEFYEQHVKPVFNVDDGFSLINDPRPSLKYQNVYTIANSDAIIGGNKMLSNNQPTEVLIDVVLKSISNGEPVLAICSLNGLNDFKMKNFHRLCDIKVNSSLEKSNRIEMRDYSEKIAMIISGISTDSNGYLEKLRFEHYTNGQRILTSIPKNNFNELVLEVVVNKRFLSDDIKCVYNLTPIVLSAYDPLTSLFV